MAVREESGGGGLNGVLGEIDATLGGDVDASNLVPTTSMGEASLTDLLQDLLTEDQREGEERRVSDRGSRSAADENLSARAETSTLDDLLKETGLDDRAEDFEDIFGSACVNAGGCSAGGGARSSVEVGETAASSRMGVGKEDSAARTWRDLDAAERQDFLKWLEEDDCTQGLEAPFQVPTRTPPIDGLKDESVAHTSAAALPSPLPVSSPGESRAGSVGISCSFEQTAVGVSLACPASASSAVTLPSTPKDTLAMIRAMLGIEHKEEGSLDGGYGGNEGGYVAEASAAQTTGRGLRPVRHDVPHGPPLDGPTRLNLEHLQVLCAHYPYGLPRDVKASVWSLLLPCDASLVRRYSAWCARLPKGGGEEGPEEEGKPTDEEEGGEGRNAQPRSDLPLSAWIRREAQAVGQALCGKEGGAKGRRVAVGEEIVRGVMFYCKNFRVDFQPEMAAAYGALLVVLGWEGGDEGGLPSNAEVVGRFHAFCTWLLPHLTLPSWSRDGHLQRVHAAFRLLLNYHAPLLVQHLDRGRAGWEAPPARCGGEGSSSQSWGTQEQARQEAEVEGMVGALEGRWAKSRDAGRCGRQPGVVPGSGRGTSIVEVERMKVASREKKDAANDGDSNHPVASLQEGPSPSTKAGREGHGSSGDSGGIVPSSWLMGHCLGSPLLAPPCQPSLTSPASSAAPPHAEETGKSRDDEDALLALVEACLLRGDRFYGLFLTTALFLRHKTEILCLQGSALRLYLEELVAGGKGIAQCYQPSLSGTPSTMTSTSASSTAVARWMEEAARVDRSTPISFRVNLTASELLSREKAASLLGSPGSVPEYSPRAEAADTTATTATAIPAGADATSPQGPEGAMIGLQKGIGAEHPPSACTQEQRAYDVDLSSLTLPLQRLIDALSPRVTDTACPSPSTPSSVGSMGPLPSRRSDQGQNVDTVTLGSFRWALGGPAREERQLRQARDDADLMALLTTQLCLTVTPEEAVHALCLPSQSRPNACVRRDAHSEAASSGVTACSTDLGAHSIPSHDGSEDPAAFPVDRLSSLRYLALDCRPKEHVAMGRFPTAYHVDPSRLDDPEEITRLLATLEPFKGSRHLLLMGTGASGGGLAPAVPKEGGGKGATPAQRFKEHMALAERQDMGHLHTAALFLLKQGFPYVSLLQGGFAAIHAFLLMKTRESSRASSAGSARSPLTLAALIDHVPSQCRMCKHEALLRFHKASGSSSLPLSPSPPAKASPGSSSTGPRFSRPLSFGGHAGPAFGKGTSGETASLAALSQLGQSSLDVLRSRATGLFGKLQAQGQAHGGEEGKEGGGLPQQLETVHDMGNFLKGTMVSLGKRAEQAVQEARSKAQGAGTGASGGGGGGEGGGQPAATPFPRFSSANRSTNEWAGHHQVASSSDSAQGSVQTGAPRSQQGGEGGTFLSAYENKHSAVFVIEDDEGEDMDEVSPKQKGCPLSGGKRALESGLLFPAQACASMSPTLAQKTQTNDLDRELALKQHALNGLQKGGEVSISPEALPGAQLFSVYKLKKGARSPSSSSPTSAPELARYIVLTPERIIVLEEAGRKARKAGQGRVKSNHHLTELARMTFMKREPDIVTLYFRNPECQAGTEDTEAGPQKKENLKGRAYRIGQKEEFIAALQLRLQRFK